MGRLVGRALGFGRRRRGRSRREPGRNILLRELQEEWSVAPARVQGEALLRLPHKMVMFIGQAWLAEGAEEDVTPDHEHDAFACGRARSTSGRRSLEKSCRGWHAGSRSERGRAAQLQAPEVGLVHPLLHLHGACWCAPSRSASHSRSPSCWPEPWPAVDLHVAPCIAAARLRIVSLRLAVAVAVLGGIGPFFGSYEFIREERSDPDPLPTPTDAAHDDA